MRTMLLVTAFQTLLPSLIPLATAPDGAHIDYAAHFGGAIGGALIGAILLLRWPAE
jgi:rhomboid protease GluP